MIFWICCLVTITCGLGATYIEDLKKSILCLWGASLGVGGIFLSTGFEFLAILQWVVATVIAISFVFYTVMFGEFADFKASRDAKKQDFIATLLSTLLGIAFSFTIWIAVKDLEQVPFQISNAGILADLGDTLVTRYLLALEIVGITLFLVLIGTGLIVGEEGEK